MVGSLDFLRCPSSSTLLLLLIVLDTVNLREVASRFRKRIHGESAVLYYGCQLRIFVQSGSYVALVR
jgi:hypothetical protein